MSPRIVVRVITNCSLFILLEAAPAQTAPPVPTRPPSTAAPTTGAPNVNIPTTLPSTTTAPSNTKPGGPAYNPPIFLTGRVALEDGSPPPEPVTIERICGSSARAEGYTDSRGNFGIELGNENGVFQDASETTQRTTFPGGGGLGGQTASSGGAASPMGSFTKYQNCELRARLAGYRSQSISLANVRPLDDPNIGTILLHKDGAADTGTKISASSLGAPKDARKAYEHGLQDIKKSKTDDAVKEFEKAVQLYPDYAEAWFELGRTQIDAGNTEAARQSFASSIKADPKYINPHVQLALLALHEKQWKELADISDRGMRLDSFEYPQLFLFNAVANYNLHKFDAAERSIKQATRLDTQHRFPDIMRLNGLILVLHKDYSAAADQFRLYLKSAPNGEDAATVRAQLTELDHLTARSAADTPKEK
jgi:tetratricopeptide (TPR) repeat protein